MYASLDALIDANRQILLICHVAPDGDAIGSMLGMYWLLHELGKDVVAACQDEVLDPLRFLPGWDSVISDTSSYPTDLIISLDSSDLGRLGDAYQPDLHASLPLVNIDHHVTNTRYGTVNLIDSGASSTAEMVHNLATTLSLPLDARAAQCLLTGLVTDTRCFRTSNVTPSVLASAQRLMETGASLTLVTEHVLNQQSVGSICLWGKALSNFRLEERVIWTAIPLSFRAACDGVAPSDSGLANFLVSADGADMAAVLSEREEGIIDIGLRASPGFDVAQVALGLGGGGHPQAAGCTLYMSLDQAQERVIPALKTAGAQQRTLRSQ